VDALRAECEQVSGRYPIVANLTLRSLPKAIPSDMAIGLFRIAQEGLRNAVRHGRASKANLFLWGIHDGLQLVVEDNGVGFDPNEHKNRPSLGLASMRERSRLLGGTLFVESTPHHGATIIAWVPLTESLL
jgi:signal transduction histidine kinase